ncbi:hypothetical protein EAE96_003940 [Botrytis aclada]|nr:hypothetical protein EAE96_003940 [Botrytis aclada]
MADHTPDSSSSYHGEPREMELEYKTEKDLDSSSHLKEEGKEEFSISNEPLKSNILDPIKSSTIDGSHNDSQELRDEDTEIKANSVLSDGKTQTASRKERLYELVAAGPFHDITSSTLDFIYTTLEDESASKSSELGEEIGQAFSALEEEIFSEDKEVVFENFPKLSLEVRNMIWEQALLEPKVVRIGIVPTERTIVEWQRYFGDLDQIVRDVPMLLERNHILKSPPCSLLSVNRESRKQALQVHGKFFEQKSPCKEAEDGYVSINCIYVNWEIDTVWLDYNLATAWRDNIIDPSDRLFTPPPAYEKVRRLALPAEAIEWPCEMQVSDIGLAIADFPNLKDLALIVPTNETVGSDPILVPHALDTTFFDYLKESREALGDGLDFFISEDVYDLNLENYDMKELIVCVYHAFQHTMENFYAEDREEEIAAGYIRDLSTWEWPDVEYVHVSTTKEENVRDKAEALLELLPEEVYDSEVDEEDTDGQRRGVSSFSDMMILRGQVFSKGVLRKNL